MNENERSGTIGLDWLGRGWRGGRGMAASLVPLAYLSPHPTPHPTPHPSPPQSFSTPHSTSI